MRTINLNATQPVESFSIGKRGENDVTQVVFDYSAWFDEFGSGTCTLLVKRPSDANAYPVVMTYNDCKATWLISSTDTFRNGFGKAEFTYTVGGKICKSVVFGTRIIDDIGAASESPPSPYETWLDTLTDIGTQVQADAQYVESVARDISIVSIENDILTFTPRGDGT